MKFTPAYGVIYHGEFHRAGQSFEIDPADAEEMNEHGNLEQHDPPQKRRGKLVK